VEGAEFHSDQSAYLAGFVAATLADTTRSHIVSSVGGYKLPTVEASVAGFEAGARYADPDIGLRHVFTDEFTNKQPCRNAAQNQIAHGSEVVFDVAGRCGIGALTAARRAGRWGIGVDIDQSYLGKYILTSALKNLNLAVFRLARLVVDDRLHTGGDLSFDLRNHGVGLAPLSSKVPSALRRQLDRQVK